MTPEHAQPDELLAAFDLLFQHLRADERQFRAARAVELISRGDLDARGVFVLRDAHGVAGALVCSMVEGNGSLIWPPSVADRLDAFSLADRQDALIRAACDWLRRSGTRLTQALVPPGEEYLAAPLLRNGFRHIAGLAYLEHSFSLGRWLFSREPGVDCEPYRLDDPDEFHRTLERTYEGTLDCPEVNGIRSIDEVIRGHQAQGRFDPSRWWLVRVEGRSAGVLMLIEQPESGDWELAYMGLVPEFRRRGLGRDMLCHALRASRVGGAARVMLCVDDRNAPAVALYQSVGFVVYDRRAVYLALW